MQGQIAIGAISNGFLLRPYFGDWNAAYNFSWWNCFITFTPDSWIFATAFSRPVEKKKSVQKYRDRNPRVYVLRSHRVIPRFLTILYLSVCLSDVFTPALKHSRCLRETRLYIYIYSILYTKRLKCNRLPLPLPFRVFASNNKYRDRYFLPPLCENSRERIYPRRMISNSILRKKKKKERNIRISDVSIINGWSISIYAQVAR